MRPQHNEHPEGTFDTPKSGKTREGAISDGTLHALAELRKVSLDPGGFIFASETGNTPISRDNLWRRYMKPALDAAGLGWATFQVLRRTNATLSKKFGVDPRSRPTSEGTGSASVWPSTLIPISIKRSKL